MGELQADRWKSYQKLKAENDYIEDRESYMIAKGKREKEISKLIKKMPIRVQKEECLLEVYGDEYKRKNISGCVAAICCQWV